MFFIEMSSNQTTMTFPAIISVAGIGATIMAFAALAVPFLYIFTAPEGYSSLVPDTRPPDYSFASQAAQDVEAPVLSCKPSNYRTEIICLDPLLIYIHSFVHNNEIESLLAITNPLIKSSQVTNTDQNPRYPDRTSSRAVLPLQDHTVQCVLSRAREFMGTVLLDGRDEIGPPQVVRYTAGSNLNTPQDWYEGEDDNARTTFNHIASIRVTLHADCTGGEMYYPFVGPLAGDHSAEDSQSMGSLNGRKTGPIFKEHEDGGLAFRPLQGNAIFTIDIHRNGSRDSRTKHAALPLIEGEEIAMNLWPERNSAIV